jgi:hypothetical protein
VSSLLGTDCNFKIVILHVKKLLHAASFPSTCSKAPGICFSQGWLLSAFRKAQGAHGCQKMSSAKDLFCLNVFPAICKASLSLWDGCCMSGGWVQGFLSAPMMDPVFLSCLPIVSTMSAFRKTFFCLLPVTSYNAVVCMLNISCLLVKVTVCLLHKLVVCLLKVSCLLV